MCEKLFLFPEEAKGTIQSRVGNEVRIVNQKIFLWDIEDYKCKLWPLDDAFRKVDTRVQSTLIFKSNSEIIEHTLGISTLRSSLA